MNCSQVFLEGTKLTGGKARSMVSVVTFRVSREACLFPVCVSVSCHSAQCHMDTVKQTLFTYLYVNSLLVTNEGK